MSDISRVEQLLRNALGEDVYEVTPQSRVEELLQQLNELIEDIDASVDPTVIESIVIAWLSEHPEATTTVQDGAITLAKLHPDVRADVEEISALKEILSDLESDGVAPSAEQLLSKNMTADAVPYLFRQTGGNGADREYVDAIVGGTVGWNQLLNKANFPATTAINGVTFTNNGDGSISVSGEASAQTRYSIPVISALKGHKVLLIGCPSGGNYSTYCLLDNYQASNKYDLGSGKIYEVDNNSGDVNVHLNIANEYAITGTLVFKPQCFDLTAMFGSTIADHIYSLEQATAGAGVALFKSLFPKDYYPYNAGELLSVSGLSEHRTVGFNQWDEEWENGYFSFAGVPSASTTAIRSKNFCPCVGGLTYYYFFGGSVGTTYIMWYDHSQTIIGQRIGVLNATVTAPSNAAFFKICTNTEYGTTYKNDICINFSDPAKNGTYEPYQKHSYPLDSTLTLRGIPKLSDGKMYYDGDRYLPDGKVERRYGIVDLGTLTWHLAPGTSNIFRASLTTVKSCINSVTGNAICTKYVTIRGQDIEVVDKSIVAGMNNSVQIMINDSAYTDATAFQTSLSGVYLVYELATPTTEEATPYRQLQICDPNGTEEFVSTGIVPVGHNTKYPDNLRAKLDGLPWNFANLIAPTESEFKATRNYTTGQLLIVNNVLYKATANIANGATITPNTNVTATTLAEVIAALS